MSQSLQEALFKSVLGYNESALSILTKEGNDANAKDFQFAVTKAKIQLSLGRPEDAIKTLDELGIGGYDSAKDSAANEQCYQLWITMQVMAKAFLMNNEPKSAQVCINECAKVWAKLQSFVGESEIKEFESSNKALQARVDMELQNTQHVGDLNQFAFIQAAKAPAEPAQPVPATVRPRINPKYDWYQNHSHVFISFKVEGGDKMLAKNTKVAFEKQCIIMESADQTINVQLSNEIEAENSVSNPFEKKLELKLKKVQEGMNWTTLEPGTGIVGQAAAVPVQATTQARPYASKKNWDQIDQEIKKDLENEKPEGDAALNGLFKQIYERADPDTRRAMMKSYQTSGGTVLSTNWGEVADKDYEGKDRPSAPDGQMWADEAERIRKKGQ